MAKCPLCGSSLDWAELINQMIEKGLNEETLKDREKFLASFRGFVFKCPHCGEEFYGRNLPEKEAEKVFELLNEFKGSIDWEKGKVRLRLNSLLALDTMLEKWDEKMRG
ncbi:hypothetical protein A3L09_07230 [Thermococcus profundus]|uniref:Uncharacterized protein n=1 Tax=Thermococcus profundus TaxID=49899 RepID=A0A2Z2MKV1_THEPR|nr:hypothetical protein [Thermococcus profundus]ASJ03061.1 hypothetical protein A3L09_07230 [Thermococcus profundus]